MNGFIEMKRGGELRICGGESGEGDEVGDGASARTGALCIAPDRGRSSLAGVVLCARERRPRPCRSIARASRAVIALSRGAGKASQTRSAPATSVSSPTRKPYARAKGSTTFTAISARSVRANRAAYPHAERQHAGAIPPAVHAPRGVVHQGTPSGGRARRQSTLPECARSTPRARAAAARDGSRGVRVRFPNLSLLLCRRSSATMHVTFALFGKAGSVSRSRKPAVPSSSAAATLSAIGGGGSEHLPFERVQRQGGREGSHWRAVHLVPKGIEQPCVEGIPRWGDGELCLQPCRFQCETRIARTPEQPRKFSPPVALPPGSRGRMGYHRGHRGQPFDRERPPASPRAVARARGSAGCARCA